MNDPIQFASIDLYEEDEGIAVPSREEAGLPVEQMAEDDPLFALRRERRFVDEARRKALEQGEPGPFVPFMSYWPTYEQMNAQQLAWYYYWRSEVRSGRYPATDLSYLFVHVYELLNGVGFSEPKDGFEQLLQIWDAYAASYPRLGSYLKEWTFDFLLVHRLDVSLAELLIRTGIQAPPELAALAWEMALQESPSSVSLELLLQASDYDLRRSRFYQSEGQELLSAYLPKCLALADAYWLKTAGIKLAERYGFQEKKRTRRYLFRSAVYDQSLYGRTIEIYTNPIAAHPPFRTFVTELIRFTENKLRELRSFKGRLKNVVLEPGLARVVSRYLEQQMKEKQTVKRPEPIQINPYKLAVLQQDTEVVQNLLTIEEPLVEEAWNVGPRGEGEGEEEEEEQEQRAGGREEGPTSIQATQWLLDNLQEPGSDVSDDQWDLTGLDEDWKAFALSLQERHLVALLAIRDGAAEQKLIGLAGEYGTMPELLIDEINEAAMNTIGDLVIDGLCLVEEYRAYFEDLKG